MVFFFATQINIKLIYSFCIQSLQCLNIFIQNMYSYIKRLCLTFLLFKILLTILSVALNYCA